jgi:DNA-binding beta-propeller fold protein YncE
MALARTGFIPVPPGNEAGFDHADIYSDGVGGHRLYVAHTGADRVDVIDCASGSFLRSLPDHPGVAGVLIDSGQDRLFTSDRAAAQVSIYRCSDEELLARVSVGARPNGLAYDPDLGCLLAFNLGEPVGENCTASVIDLDTYRVVATISLPGRPRWATYDPETRRVYANIREPAQILVIDPDAANNERVIAVPADGPHGLWIDGTKLFCAADGGALVVLDRDTGTVLASIPLPGQPDVLMHDPDLAHMYVAIGEPGVICVVDSSRLQLVETVPTEAGAHTIAVDADDHSVYAFLPNSCGAAAYKDE